MIEGIVIGLVLGIVIHQLWQSFWIWRTVREIEKASGRSMAEIIQELSDEDSPQSQEIKDLDCELVNGQLLIYDRETQQFVAQGASLETATAGIERSLGAGPYRIRFKFEGEALERIQRELEKA